MSSPSAGPAQYPISDEEFACIPKSCRPKALAAVPRLGLGSRTTVLGWPVIFSFLSSYDIFANAIQNSVARELMPLEMLTPGSPRARTYLPGLESVDVGHTGSTIEGLLRCGAAAAEVDYSGPGYGADADHLPVYYPDSPKWERTVHLIRCSREYTHFTLDLGSVMDWDKEPVVRLTNAPRVVAAAQEVIRSLKQGEPFDLEISLDESPEGVPPEIAATKPDEIGWLLSEMSRLSVQLTYLAPHLGFHKGGDASEGEQEQLEEHASGLHRIACNHGALLSIHSGDYLSRTTRRTLGKACDSRLLFKVSPAIQNLYIDAVVSDDPELAAIWSAWAVAYAVGKGVVVESPDQVFRKYAFAAFGHRTDAGQFEMRERLYRASESAVNTFGRHTRRYLEQLSADLFSDSDRHLT